jgi:hypothetical protein
VKKKPFVDRPVRVIMNQPDEDDEDAEWYVMEVTLRDPSQWMSDYEEFVSSVFSDAAINIAHQELIDSHTLKLWFFDKTSMEECSFVLDEVMPEFFSVKKRDPLVPPEFFGVADVSAGGATDVGRAGLGVVDVTEAGMDFERMAEELGLGDNMRFWERFTQLVEDCDGTDSALISAFEAAVIAATSEDTDNTD